MHFALCDNLLSPFQLYLQLLFLQPHPFHHLIPNIQYNLLGLALFSMHENQALIISNHVST